MGPEKLADPRIRSNLFQNHFCSLQKTHVTSKSASRL
jgi:hypothetical protein